MSKSCDNVVHHPYTHCTPSTHIPSHREFRRCQESSGRLTKQMAHSKGVCVGREDEVRIFQTQLNSDMYKDIDKKHRDKLIDLRVRPCVCEYCL